MSKVYVAIMAGGIGSRFWPESRIKKPKQFLDILNTGETLIQTTYNRFLKIADKDNIFIVTNEQYIPLINEQLPEVDASRILAEPMRKNTAPCIAYACHKIASIDPDANIVIAPSDHIMLNPEKFLYVVLEALEYTQKNDVLVTLGIKPSRPDTGYGYIQFEEGTVQRDIHKVKTFTEKPDYELARTFIKSGDFLWNSGIFIWNVKSIMTAFDHLQQDIHQAFWAARKVFNTKDEKRMLEKAYSICPSISIDYAIMEKADNVFVIPAAFGWSDLGTWASLWDNYGKDYYGNAVKGNNVMIYDAANNMIMTPDNKLVVIQGLDDYIVVDSDDVLLICKKDKEQEIKDITADIKRKELDDFL
ncbi:MAG: NTP transferase domain-containing protein [Bacteroidetes bacterium]|nr:NTP transferase domain-containing protein [Bacteroidota bacterium]